MYLLYPISNHKMVGSEVGLFLMIGEIKERRNILFNGALNTFYLRLYGVGHMVKDH